MYFAIITETNEYQVEIPIEYGTLIEDQLTHIGDERERKAFADALIKQLARLISEFFDFEFQPPTEKQIKYAYGLSRKHKVEIPRDALIYKSVMCDFLDKYSGK